MLAESEICEIAALVFLVFSGAVAIVGLLFQMVSMINCWVEERVKAAMRDLESEDGDVDSEK